MCSLWDKPERKQWFGGGYDAAGIHSICVDPRNSQHITIAVSCGSIWQTHDGGNNWEARCVGMHADYMPEEHAEDPVIQDPHRLVQNRANPDVMWVRHHCGMYRSNDNAASWQRIHAQPSSFGFAVATHPQNADVAWFASVTKDAQRIPVDGKFVVTRTRDGGAHSRLLTRVCHNKRLTISCIATVSTSMRMVDNSRWAQRRTACGYHKIVARVGKIFRRICRRYIACGLRE